MKMRPNKQEEIYSTSTWTCIWRRAQMLNLCIWTINFTCHIEQRDYVVRKERRPTSSLCHADVKPELQRLVFCLLPYRNYVVQLSTYLSMLCNMRRMYCQILSLSLSNPMAFVLFLTLCFQKTGFCKQTLILKPIVLFTDHWLVIYANI
jgi:hypothetical protein